MGGFLKLLRGYSGFQLSVREYNNGFVFCKTTDDENGLKRLFNQRDRQVKYKQIIDSDPVLSNRFFVPSVVSSDSSGFCMEYVYGRHLLDVISECNISILDYILDQMFFWVEWCIGHSGSTGFNVGFFEKKLKSVKGVDGLKNSFVDQLRGIEGLDVPVGFCHGDFTLSNMLFLENGKLGLVDWHDTFFESPFQDIGKMFQEFVLKWSMVMGDRSCIKFDTAYDYLFNKYKDWVVGLDVDVRPIHFFNVMTLLRLFPYTKKGSVLWDRVYGICLELLK